MYDGPVAVAPGRARGSMPVTDTRRAVRPTEQLTADTSVSTTNRTEPPGDPETRFGVKTDLARHVPCSSWNSSAWAWAWQAVKSDPAGCSVESANSPGFLRTPSPEPLTPRPCSSHVRTSWDQLSAGSEIVRDAGAATSDWRSDRRQHLSRYNPNIDRTGPTVRLRPGPGPAPGRASPRRYQRGCAPRERAVGHGGPLRR